MDRDFRADSGTHIHRSPHPQQPNPHPLKQNIHRSLTLHGSSQDSGATVGADRHLSLILILCHEVIHKGSHLLLAVVLHSSSKCAGRPSMGNTGHSHKSAHVYGSCLSGCNRSCRWLYVAVLVICLSVGHYDAEPRSKQQQQQRLQAGIPFTYSVHHHHAMHIQQHQLRWCMHQEPGAALDNLL
eukprot:1158800-Pelagomonas_calceolata.AAC.10